MEEEIIEKFQKQREELNRLVMKYTGQGTKRFYNLDSQAYREGALSCKTKELLYRCRLLIHTFTLFSFASSINCIFASVIYN